MPGKINIATQGDVTTLAIDKSDNGDRATNAMIKSASLRSMMRGMPAQG